MKKLVYVAGPYTNPDPVANTRRAVQWGDIIAQDGVVTPHVPHLTMLWHTISEHDVEWWYAYDCEVLEHCDALFRLSGASTGADREVAHAEARGIPVFHDLATLYWWVGDGDGEMQGR